MERVKWLEEEIKKMLADNSYRGCIPKSVKICTPKKFVPCMVHLEREHFTEPELIACKWCGSTDIMKRGIRQGVQNIGSLAR